MWGSAYPNDEGRRRSPASTAPGMIDLPDPDSGAPRVETAAKLYGFVSTCAAPLAAQYGPTVEELSRPLTELPEKPNSALRRGAGEAVMV